MKKQEADGNAKIKQAYANAVPDICDAILADCRQEKGRVIMMTETKKKRSIAKYFMAAASLFLLLGCGGIFMNLYQVHYTVASTISLDVNPSIQITVNEKERVLDVKALNKDAGIVIGDMNFKGSDIDVTLNALIGSMLRKGYLNELANSILISVDNANQAKGEVLQKKLTEEVNELLKSDGFFGAVLGQTLTDNGALQKQADQYGITPGKAQLIQEILNSTPRHTFEELASLSINELNLLIAPAVQEIKQVSSVGNASDKAYIGEAEAKKAALTHAGVSEQDISFYKMDMDVEKGVMVYEIDFKCGGYEYEYDIDARTGDIVKRQKERDDDVIVQKPQKSQKSQPPKVVETSPNTAPPVQGNGNAGNKGNAGNTGATASASITLEKAKEIALNHAGQSASSVFFKKAKLDHDDGMQIYDIEFINGNVEYEYEINAATGEIWDYDVDYD